MSPKKIERSRTDDFRRVETHIEEESKGTGTERIITVLEEKVPMEIRKVVRETVIPVVTSRRIEEYKDGAIINTEVEVVPDHALNLAPPKSSFSKDDLKLIVQEALRERDKQERKEKEKSPERIPERKPEKEKRPKKETESPKEIIAQHMEEKNPWVDYILYAIVAFLGAAILYFTVIRNIL